MHKTADEKTGRFSDYVELINAADGLTLGQVCSLTGLEPSTIQNWIKRRFVSRPVNKKYGGRQLARIMLINSLRDCMKLEQIGELMTVVNGDTDDTGDDIISEEEMYDRLCTVTEKAQNCDIGAVPRIVSESLSGYSCETPGARDRLESVLTVMTYAYIAGRYKAEAEKRFNQLKENYHG